MPCLTNCAAHFTNWHGSCLSDLFLPRTSNPVAFSVVWTEPHRGARRAGFCNGFCGPCINIHSPFCIDMHTVFHIDVHGQLCIDMHTPFCINIHCPKRIDMHGAKRIDMHCLFHINMHGQFVIDMHGGRQS